MSKTTPGTARRLGRAALFSLVRGAGYAAGTAVGASGVWWLLGWVQAWLQI